MWLDWLLIAKYASNVSKSITATWLILEKKERCHIYCLLVSMTLNGSYPIFRFQLCMKKWFYLGVLQIGKPEQCCGRHLNTWSKHWIHKLPTEWSPPIKAKHGTKTKSCVWSSQIAGHLRLVLPILSCYFHLFARLLILILSLNLFLVIEYKFWTSQFF